MCSSSSSSCESENDQGNEERQESPESFVSLPEEPKLKDKSKEKGVRLAIPDGHGRANDSGDEAPGHEAGEDDGDESKKKDDEEKSINGSCASPVTPQPVPVPVTGPTHEGVNCDGCKVVPIVGVRWKCLRCVSYDLCDKCHSTGAHEHKDFLKIEHPDDYKIWRFAVSSSMAFRCAFER